MSEGEKTTYICRLEKADFISKQMQKSVNNLDKLLIIIKK